MSGTIRQQKFGKLILKEISEIFQRDKKGIIDQAFITVTEVQVSPDLGFAKVYLSMMFAKERLAILEKINSRKSEIRKALGEKIKKQVRVIPELVFFIDELEENATKMDKLIDSLKIPHLPKKGEE
jgi:ribosome-binding factor A